MRGQRPKNRRSLTRALSETTLVLVLLGVAAGMWVGRPAHRVATESAVNAPNLTSPFTMTGTVTAPPAFTTLATERRIYGHSLVAGGIHSISELVAVMEKNPFLREHYRKIDLSKARIITVDHDVVGYVSYRLGRAVYWETKPTVIAKGEQVITDGTTFIRTRCGNRISYIPSFPTSPGEPADMNTIVDVRLVEPLDAPERGTTYLALANPTAEGAGTPALGNPPGSSTPMAPGDSLPPTASWGIPGGGGGGSNAPFISPTPLANPPSEFSADEFSTISFTILGHSGHIPSEAVLLLAGILLVVGVHLAFWR